MTNQNWEPQFPNFLHEVENTSYEKNTTATGAVTIQQTLRNEIRKKGVAALKHDLEQLYGDEFDIVETKEGIVIVAENEPDDFTFSWEIKTTIKGLDYDPFLEASKYEDECAAKAAKRKQKEAEKIAREKMIEEKRAKKLAELGKLA